MSSIYDNWERLVAAVLDREKLRQLALLSSFSSEDYDNSSFISREESSATEIDLSSHEYSNRSNESFEEEKASVTVNGHLIPDRLIKKAEKLAGTIHPGHYWYDFRAGFWGAVGGPCLGMIPPFIEEFNYPMPEHCAGGNTHVFVNGRELHQKDLNLLGSRGLPTERYRSYIVVIWGRVLNLLGSRGLPIERYRSYVVEICGRVLDEDTGEELPGLGKLAPT